MKLITRTTGIRRPAATHAHDIADIAGHPISIMVRFSPSLSVIAIEAGPSEEVRRLITRLIPVKPIPIVIPDLNDFVKPAPIIMAKTNMIIGSITEAPRPKIHCNISIYKPPFIIFFYHNNRISGFININTEDYAKL